MACGTSPTTIMPMRHLEMHPNLSETYMFKRFVVNSPVLLPKNIFVKYNQTTLNKLEKILEETGYVIRYERGSFQSGYCILEDKKVVVLNKFLNPEGRINILIDIIPSVDIDFDALTHDSQKLYEEVKSQAEELSK